MALRVEQQIENLPAMNENPVHVRQAGKNDSPLEFFPPKHKEDNRGGDDEQMIADPNGIFEIGFGRMIGEVGQLVQKAVRQKGQRRRQAQGEFAVFGALKRFLDDDAGEDMSRLLHEREAFYDACDLKSKQRTLRTPSFRREEGKKVLRLPRRLCPSP